jgi:hypothetical protein
MLFIENKKDNFKLIYLISFFTLGVNFPENQKLFGLENVRKSFI